MAATVQTEATFPSEIADLRARLEAAEEQQSSEVFLRRIMQVVPGVLHVFDVEKQCSVFINRSVATVLGYSSEQIDAMGSEVVPKLMHPDDVPRFHEHVQRVRGLADDEHAEFEHRMRDSEGRWHWFQSRDAVFLRDGAGKVRQIVGSAIDITSRKSAEQALAKSEERLSLGLAIAGLALMEADLVTGVHDLSAGAARLFGLGDDAISVSCEEVLATIHPDDRAELDRLLEAALDPAGRGWFSVDHRVVWPDGTVHWLRSAKQVFFEGAGGNRQPVRAIVTAHDITAEKEAVDATRTNEEFVRGVLDSLPEHVVVLGDDGTVRAVNAPWERFAQANGGSPLAVAAGTNYLEICRRAAESDSHARQALEGLESLISGQLTKFEMTYPCHAPDRERWFLMCACRSKHGPSQIIISHLDISERIWAEEQLRQSEALYRGIGESIDYGVWVCAPDGRNTYASESFLKMVGISQQQCSEFGWGKVLHPDEIGDTVQAWQETVRAGRRWDREHRFRSVDGGWRHVLARGMPIRDAEGAITCWAGINLDITDLKEAQQRLRANEQRMRLATEATGVGIWEWNVVTQQIRWDAQMFRIYGIAPTAGGFVKASDWFGAVLPEDLAEQESVLQDTIRRGGPGTREFSIRRRDNGELRHIQAVETVRTNNEGTVEWVVGTNLDITDRKLAEESSHQFNEELEERVRLRTAELEAANNELETFSYSIAHDLRAPLRSIDGFSDIVATDYGPSLDAAGREYLQFVRAGCGKMSQLIDGLLKMSRLTRSPLRQEAVNLTALARRIAEDLQRLEPERTVAWHIADGMTTAGDPALLEAAVRNLVENAWKFTLQRAEAVIEVGAVGTISLASPVFYVRDNGAGFDMKYADKLFGVFQRLHDQEAFAGTGVGLATAQRILQRHGGHIWAEAAVDQGATFYFSLTKNERNHVPR